MNFFAHLVLADATVESRVGNLLGDFARGVDQQALPADVLQGLINHRRVDQFTDQHPLVRQMKPHFSQQRRRFAGIALDVLFDHYLLNHWQQFSSQPKDQVIEAFYGDLMAGQPLMPQRMQRVTRRIVESDWFGSYESLEGVVYALDRIAGRIRFNNEFQGVGEELALHYPRFEAGFQLFFTDLTAQFPSPLIDTGN
ncbi:ACP phosphodiesterase [uncultured Amphritea sp.]|uniref:acyl carrier protein phosphodiesterase n=1 Tax=uncultured Amphritea sp. TaxID=981605 RepID=UPI002620DB4C|nr:ACP phosphodiesterase [uncultured Amphritea sp.]